jgi:hypothetical protein
LFVLEVVNARVATLPRYPRTIHYRGEGVFMVSGTNTAKYRRRFRSDMLYAAGALLDLTDQRRSVTALSEIRDGASRQATLFAKSTLRYAPGRNRRRLR